MYTFRKINLNKALPNLPPKEAYLYRSMLPKAKVQFERWYEENKNQPFSLSESLASYCCNDVCFSRLSSSEC